MNAVRSIEEVVAGQVTIKLPPYFAGKRVEVIVLPVAEDKHEQLQELLLKAPTLSEEELSGFTEIWAGRGELARQTAGMGRSWLPSGVDPVADLIAERAREDDEEDAP